MIMTFDESRPRQIRVLRPEEPKEKVQKSLMSDTEFHLLLEEALRPYTEARIAVANALGAWEERKRREQAGVSPGATSADGSTANPWRRPES